MMNQEERKGQRLYERDFARERREELLPFLEKIVKELKSSDQDVDTIQQLLYDAILQNVQCVNGYNKQSAVLQNQ